MAGWNPDAPAHELPVTEAAVLDNFLIQPGKLVMRGPFKQMADLSAIANPLTPMQAVGIGNWMLLTRWISSNTACVEPANSPLVKATGSQLVVPNNTVVYANLAGTFSTASATYSVFPMKVINFGGQAYMTCISGAATMQDSAATYTVYSSSLYKCPLNSTGSAPTLTLLTTAPMGVFDLVGYQQRLWALGGADTPAGSSVHSATTLYFSNVIASGAGGAGTDWQDPVSGLTNKIPLDGGQVVTSGITSGGNTDDFGVALGVVRNGLCILRRKSIWLLKGSTTANYTLLPVSREIGCVDRRSVLEMDEGMYFVSHRGLMLTDGVKVENVSGSVMYTLQQAIHIQQSMVTKGFGGYIRCHRISTGQVLVTIGINAFSGTLATPTSATGHIAPIWSGVYDPTVKGGAWTRITSNLWTGDATQVAGNAYPVCVVSAGQNQLYAFGDRYLTQLEDITLNSSSPFSAGGSVGQAAFDIPVSGNMQPIPARWKSHLLTANLSAATRKYGQAKRWFIDYNFQGNGSMPASGFQVAPVNASGATYGGATAVALTEITGATTTSSVSLGGPLPTPALQRQNQDFVSEIDSLQYDVTVPYAAQATAPTNAVIEIYGIGTEAQPSRDLR